MDCILCSSNSYADAGSPESAAFRDRASGKGMKVTWVLRVRLSSDRVGGLTERGSEARALCACAEERPRGATASRRPSSVSQRERPDRTPTPATLWSARPAPEWRAVSFCGLSHPVHGIWLWPPEQTYRMHGGQENRGTVVLRSR